MYLDNAATTPLTVEVKSAIQSFLNNYGNPSSSHSVGDGARMKLIESREAVAKFINANPSEIYFTSGGSASNNLAIQGWFNKYVGSIFYSPTCHKSIIKQFTTNDGIMGRCLATNSAAIPLDKGVVDCAKLSDILSDRRGERNLVVIEYANSETGVIQPVDDVIYICRMFGANVFIDCTGSISQIPVDVKSLDPDMIAFSGHKLGALKGCGVLYIRDGFEISPLIYGAQECGLFGGTENMIGIISLGAAVKHYDYSSITVNKRDYLWSAISHSIPKVRWIGGGLPHNLYVVFDGIKGSQLMTMLDSRGYQVSTGSACNSGSPEPSASLVALKVPEALIHNGIRITLSGDESFGGLDGFVSTLKECVEWLRNE